MAIAKSFGRGSLVRPDAAIPEQVTYLDPAVQKAIKHKVREVWERVRANLVLNQAGLAAALKVSQSNTSRLLQSDAGHPWTPARLKQMAQYLNVDPLSAFIPKEYESDLRPFFDGYSPTETMDAAFLSECLGGIHRYFLEQGINVPLDNLQALAGKLYARLRGKQPTREDMQREIRALVHQQAAGI
jgi:transcriptional regulator with XRE-family HTH domain